MSKFMGIGRYEKLVELLNAELGKNYDIKYFDNDIMESKSTWNDLIENCESDKVNGVLALVDSDSTKLGGILVETCNVPVSLLIPLDYFMDEIQHIEEVMNALNLTGRDWGTEYVEINYQGRSDAEKYTINGAEYATVTLNVVITATTNAVSGTKAYVKVKNEDDEYEKLNGVSNIVFQSSHQNDGVVLGVSSTSSAVQENHLAGVSKSITIDLVLCKDDELQADFMENEDTNKQYDIKYFNGFITRNMKMSVIALTEYIPVGNTIKAQLVLGIKQK